MAQGVLVIAGASGIGLAIARSFVDAGAMVHIADIDAQAVEDVTRSDARITGSVVDVRDTAAVAGLFCEIHTRHGGLDVLVNNAGIAGPTAAINDYPDDAWAAVIAVKLTGTFNVTKAAIPLLSESGEASVIIMSSLAGRFGYPNRCAYGTTKWGLIGFAKTLSIELGPQGITCNAILPGALDGARMTGVLQARAELAGTTAALERDKVLSVQSVVSRPQDIAALAVFLAGPHARTITGQSFPVDGDSKATQ